MTQDERLSIIEQLKLATAYNESVYQHYTDDQLEKELERHYGIKED